MPSADLSVVIANRNHAQHLPRALDAVLSQSVRPREVIVLDDASTDSSRRILEQYARRHSCIRLEPNQSRRGVPETYNRGFSLATGEYVLPGSADDYILQGFIEKAMNQLAKWRDAGLCVTFGSCTEGDDGPLIVNDPGWCERPTYFTPDELCRRVWHNLPVSAVVVRRDALLSAGGYRPELAWYSDWFAFLVVAFRHGAIHIPETLGIHVFRPDSYAKNAKPGEANIRILGSLLSLLTSPDIADVASYFRRNGAACHFGHDLIRAAARRDDFCEPKILGFLAGFTPQEYEQLASDPDCRVRKLASIFLQEPWSVVIARRADVEAENRRLVEEIQLARLRAAPAGTLAKLNWAAGLLRRRIRKAAGFHPVGRFR